MRDRRARFVFFEQSSDREDSAITVDDRGRIESDVDRDLHRIRKCREREIVGRVDRKSHAATLTPRWTREASRIVVENADPYLPSVQSNSEIACFG
jgi:hypothetical protein